MLRGGRRTQEAVGPASLLCLTQNVHSAQPQQLREAGCGLCPPPSSVLDSKLLVFP